MLNFINFVIKTITGTVVGLVTAIGLVCLCCVAVIAIIAFAQNQESQRLADEFNDGFGMEDNPVAAGQWVNFEDARIRAVQVDPNVTDNIDRAPAGGAIWYAVRLEMSCNIERCEEFQFRMHVIDQNGNEHDEHVSVLWFKSNGYLYNDALDDAILGGTSAGWQVFEIPQDATPTSIKYRWKGGPTLYQRLP